jgi:hypothetical protein
MDEPTQDDLFLDVVDAIVLDVLARIADDPRAGFPLLKRPLAVVQELAEERERCRSWTAPFGPSVGTRIQSRYVGSG